MAAHRYWRLLITATNGSAFCALSEMQLRTSAGGADVSDTHGAPIKSSEFDPSNAAYRAFDSNTATLWASDGSALPQWIGWDFGGSGGDLGLPAGTPQDIEEFTITSRADGNASQIPKDFTLQWSDDASSWTDGLAVTGETAWGAPETRTFTGVDSGASPSAARPVVFVCT